MLFALICDDKPNSLELRLKMRPDHVAFLNGLGTALKFAGPFTDDAGSPVGSLVVIQSESRAAIQALSAQDPYAIAGLFQSVDIRPWKWALKNPEAV